jgi:uncharacterized protein YecE (DUF72 family)
MADETPDLFASPPAPPKSIGPLDLPRYRQQIAQLAAHRLYIGTSSWKYPGWNGGIYDEQNYLTRGKFSEAKFERECLSEYAQTFRSVCVDAGYYRFPNEGYIGGMAAQVPVGFQFAFKVTEDITIKRFPNLPKHGQRAGMENPNFLNAEMFTRLFLGPCELYRDKIGPLIFEFSQFSQADFEHGHDFVTRLDQFLGALPRGWRFAVELRNRGWLVPEYFAMLRSHNVAHVFSNWTRMPSALEQLGMDGSDTADFMVARMLLKPGRGYEAAVEQFSPYKEIQEINEEARLAVDEFLERSFRLTKHGYVYINNRLEGFAPGTIAAIIRNLEEAGRKYVLIR